MGRRSEGTMDSTATCHQGVGMDSRAAQVLESTLRSERDADEPALRGKDYMQRREIAA